MHVNENTHPLILYRHPQDRRHLCDRALACFRCLCAHGCGAFEPVRGAALCDQSLCALCAADVHDDLGGAALARELCLQLQAEVFLHYKALRSLVAGLCDRRPGDARSQRRGVAVAGGDACQLDPRTVPFLVSADALGRLPADAAARPPEGAADAELRDALAFCHHLHLQSAVAVSAAGGQRRRRAGDPHAPKHDALFHARRRLSAPRAALAQAGDPFGAGGAGWLCDPALSAFQHAGLRLGKHRAAALQLQ